ncbi:biosynthetic-type acetolactate synthase large subunit [Candidatus Saccharibacteria bacterium]|nr:biosynthetic-type acetolactate synthase large subunit [Candidatus Saccharibacteria bacterium]
MDGATAIIRTLEKHGVEYIFGYSGGAAIPLFDAIVTSKTKIKLILVRHEQGAAHIADGYARASGKPGVVLVTSGPGAGNIVTGLMTAHMDSVPLIVISGQQITSMLGLDAFQEADVFNITMPVVKHNYLAKKVDDLPRIIDEAFYIATTGRPGPVLVDVPKDISSGEFNGNLKQSMQLPAYVNKYSVDKNKIQSIVKTWQTAKRPVILAGHGVIISGAADNLLKLAQKTNTPVATTLLGKGSIDETSPLSVGMVGMHGTAYANKSLIECDFLLNIGSRFDDRIIGKADEFCANAYIAHIDIDAAEANKMISVDLFLQADAKEAINDLIENCKPMNHDTWNTKLDDYKKLYPLTYDDSQGLTMQHVIDAVYDITKGNAIVTTDVGQHQMWSAQFYKTKKADTWISSGGAGTMGFGMPSAIGAHFAHPDKQVVAFVGDGGFQMTQFELATACINKLPIKVIVLNNHYLGMVRQWQELFYDNRESGVDLEGNPDFAMLAQSYGAAGIVVNNESELEPKLKEAFAINDRPVIISVEVTKSQNVFPMIPPGAPLKNMIIFPPKSQLSRPVGST